VDEGTGGTDRVLGPGISFGRLGLGEALVQPGPNVVGRVCITSTLISGNERTGGRDSDDTGQADQLPYVAHTASVPKLRL
jgi:hypothetical protein